MGIIIPEYMYEPVGVQLSNVYASTQKSEFHIQYIPSKKGLVLTFRYFIWLTIDIRRANKSFIGSVLKKVMYDDTLPIMTQIYNAIKADFTDAIDVLMDPEPVSGVV